MALSVAAPTAGTLQILGAVVIGTLDASGAFVQYASVSYKSPVRVATTVAGTLASSFENGDTVDGIVLATGDRILIKNQVAAADNGIYVVAASGAPARASDFDSWTEIPGSVVGVLVGTANADTAWLCTSDSGGTIGSTTINFTQFGAGVTYPITPAQGGTGVANNASSTLTISGNFGTTFTVAGTTALTLPTSGIVATTATSAWIPAADMTVTQNSVAVITSTAANATVNTLVLKQGRVGIGTTPDVSGANRSPLQIVYSAGLGQITLADNATDNADKSSGISMGHYQAAWVAFQMFYGSSTTGANTLNVGGGNAGNTTATEVAIYAAATTTTVTGTKVLSCNVTTVAVQSGIIFQVGSTAEAAVAVASTHKISIKDATGTVYKVLAVT